MVVAQICYFIWGLQKWPCSNSVIPSSSNWNSFLKRKISLINYLETLRIRINAWSPHESPVFRIISWFPSIFQKWAIFFLMNSWSLIHLTCLTQLQLLFLLMLKLSHLWLGRGFSLWLPSPFDIAPDFFNCFLAFIIRYPGCLLHFLPQPRVSHFAKETVLRGCNLKVSSVYYYCIYYCF